MLSSNPSIMSFVIEMDKGNILLPMVQRPFVWLKDEEKITKLFDSVIRRFPIGIFLLYEKPNNSNTKIFGRKFFENINKNTNFEDYDVEIQEKQILVLDGHQRLQSLYLGVKDGSLYGKHLYHDVRFFFKSKEMSEISFRLFKSDEKVVYVKNDDALYIRFSKIIDIAEKIANISPQKKIQQRKVVLSELEELIKPVRKLSSQEYNDIYNYISETISTSLFFRHDSRIFKYELIENKDFDEEVLEIFVRFNQGGLPLTKSDLIFSTLKLEWKDGGKNFEKLSEETSINKDLLLKTLIIVSDLPANTKICKIKENIEKLKNNYEQFESIVKQFHDKIIKLTARYDRIYRKYNFIIPVIYYFFKNKNKLKKIEDLSIQPNILEYILIIVYNSNLRSDSHLNKIVEIISQEESKGKFPLEKIKEHLEKKGVKITIDDISLNSDPILTFSLLQRNNWNPLYEKNRLHVDHIFPISKKEELPEELRPLVDTIFNKYVVFATDNIRKSATYPENYFTGDKEKLIETYILPKEYIKKEHFEKMIKWRREKIKKLFKMNLNLEISL